MTRNAWFSQFVTMAAVSTSGSCAVSGCWAWRSGCAAWAANCALTRRSAEEQRFLRGCLCPRGSSRKKLKPKQMPSIRILLADDHTMVRDGLRALLAGQHGIEIVAEAADGRECM